MSLRQPNVAINRDHMAAGSNRSVQEIHKFLDTLTKAGLLDSKCTWTLLFETLLLTVPDEIAGVFAEAGYAVMENVIPPAG
jgi:hypothetical protein